MRPNQRNKGEKVRASLVAQAVKNLPAMKETRVRPLGGEDRLEEGMATHSSVLGQRSPADCHPRGGKESGMTERLTRTSFKPRVSVGCTFSRGLGWKRWSRSRGTQPPPPTQAPLPSTSLLDHSRTCDDLRRSSAGLSLQDHAVRWELPKGWASVLHPGV